MKLTIVVLMLVLTGCATTQAVHPPIIAENRRPELRELPRDARETELPDGIPTSPGEDAVDPIEEGEQAPRSGILISEARAVRDGLVRIGYEELRRVYVADRQVWTAHRELYEEQIRRDREALEEAQPDWWDRNGTLVIGVITFLAGAALTVGLAAALDEAVE